MGFIPQRRSRQPRPLARTRTLGAQPGAALAPEWRAWVAENLVLGAAPESIVQGLVARGVTHGLALKAVKAAQRAPELVGARKATVRARRATQVVELLREQQKHLQDVRRLNAAAIENFYEQIMAVALPVAIVDLVTQFPAWKKWTPEYLRERFGEHPVDVTEARNTDPRYDQNARLHTRQCLLRDFVDRVMAAGETNDFYMVARGRNTARPELLALFDDVVLPDGWIEREHMPASSALWFGPAGTITPLHHDTSSILFCQVYGRKRIRLVSPLDLDMYELAESLYCRREPEDLPASTRCFDVTLEPGEALYIPAGYWHHVRSLDVAISLGLNGFLRPNHFDWFRPGEIA